MQPAHIVVKQMMEQALQLYQERPVYEGYSKNLPARDDLDAIDTTFQIENSTITLWTGSWYQPALARYEGPLGKWEACLKGDGEFFEECTQVRDRPYWQGTRHFETERFERIMTRLYGSPYCLRSFGSPLTASPAKIIVDLEEKDRWSGGGTIAGRAASELRTRMGWRRGWPDIVYPDPQSLGLVFLGEEHGELTRSQLSWSYITSAMTSNWYSHEKDKSGVQRCTPKKSKGDLLKPLLASDERVGSLKERTRMSGVLTPESWQE